MAHDSDAPPPTERQSALAMDPEEFRSAGHALVDRVADLLGDLRQRPVTPADTPEQVRAALGADRPVPTGPIPPATVLDDATTLLFDHSLFNGHPRFFGYITSSAAPIGVLGDMLAAAVNPNVGGWTLSPLASELEAQTVRWLAEWVGFPTTAGGLLVSGGNMANFVGFLAARTAKAPWAVRQQGLRAGPPLRVYGSTETHTWIQKAADVFGLGTEAIRWVDTDRRQRLDPTALDRRIAEDRAAGDLPFLVVGTAGTAGTGAIDPLPAIAAVCRAHDVWFHVDGAYGAAAAPLPNAPAELGGIAEADSVAVDPHKWLYAPLEAGCALVREPGILERTFSYRPPYYHLEQRAINYFDLGFQNSRGFRALKVWLALRQAGREGLQQMIADDIQLAGHLYWLATGHPELEAVSWNLSITTFRYVPPDLRDVAGSAAGVAYLNALNEDVLGRVERSGRAFVSNAVVDGRFLLRACVVNFRTTLEDLDVLISTVVELGGAAHAEHRPGSDLGPT